MVDISELTDEEVLLVDAIEGMRCQYGPYLGSESWFGLDKQVVEILVDCGLHEISNSKLVPIYGVDAQVRIRDIALERANLNLRKNCDPLSLNNRARNMLILLAAMADKHLKYPEGWMMHESMSAGEHALSELQSYGLVRKDEDTRFHWTEEGLKALL